jgi:NOL1/NOP2/fmu family ribosome biogenesis protein
MLEPNNWTILNAKEIKIILSKISDNWGCDETKLKQLFENHVFLNASDDKIYISKREVFDDNLNLKPYSYGIYFGTLSNNSIRLTIEGAQIIEPFANKNVIVLSEEDSKKWIKGEDLDYVSDKEENKTFKIIKCNSDVLGTARYKDNTLLNHIPKTRRIGDMH